MPQTVRDGKELRFQLRQRGFACCHTLQATQVNQDIEQRVLVGDGPLVAQFGTFNAQVEGLAVDAFASGALFVKLFVLITVAIQFVTHTIAKTSGQSGDAALLLARALPVFVSNRADRPRFFLGKARDRHSERSRAAPRYGFSGRICS
jgi:hypothetical protein